MPHKYILRSHFNAEAKFSIDYAKELTEEQLAVVTAPGGPMLAIAGAGSGKTRTVTYRVAYLVESGVPLDRILLVTFTNKAAKEMLSRVELLLKRDVRGICGGTFHHVGNLMLRKHAKLIGYGPNFTILDRADSKDLIDKSITQANIDIQMRRFPKGETLQAIFGLSVNTGRKIIDIVADNYPQFEPLTDDIERVFNLYQARKKDQNLMDFDDLLLHWWKLLAQNPEIAEKYSHKFQHILVDEYQDTNLIQAKIIDILAKQHRNLMVVGDDSQSIYSFRGAHFKNIMNFPKVYSEARVHKLELNHRSVPEILDLANETINQAKEKFAKTLRANRPSGQKPVVAPLTTAAEQAAFVVQRMLELREEGLSLNDMAVLYRSHYQSMEIQMEMTKRGIPFEVRSGLRFFEEAHIKDVLAHLKLFHNWRDEAAWARALKLLDKIGPRTAEKVFGFVAGSRELGANSILADEALKLIPRGGEAGFKKFQNLIEKLSEQVNSPAEMIKIVAESYYADYLRFQYANHKERLEDLEQLGSYATQFKDLEELLSALALVSGMESETVVGGDGGDKEACVLSTVHQAKGLEWKIVFVVWLADGRFPSYLSFNKEEEMEEERRLFYVAITRAKDELYLTYPIIYSSYDGEVLMKSSRYIEEMPEGLYEKWEVAEEVPWGHMEAVELKDLDFMK
ncbi:MAG: ATP-dependent helicase [Candidatus Margulisbacteria bacterium]|nr:ATP-dependent helicase [Candidatus Margulisiibacteriota bacterium]